jgi:hypothetical protein
MNAPESEYCDAYVSFFIHTPDERDFQDLLKLASESQIHIFLTKEEALDYHSYNYAWVAKPWFGMVSFPNTKANHPVEHKEGGKKSYQTSFPITSNHVKKIITPDGNEFLNPNFDPTAHALPEDNALPLSLKSALQAVKCRKVYSGLIVPRMDQYTVNALLEWFDQANHSYSYISPNKRAAVWNVYRERMVTSQTECLIVIAMIPQGIELRPTHATGFVITPRLTKKDIIGFEIHGQFFANPEFDFDLDAKISIANQKVVMFPPPPPAQKNQKSEVPAQGSTSGEACSIVKSFLSRSNW